MQHPVIDRVRPVFDTITSIWVRSRNWRLRHPTPMKILVAVFGLVLVLAGRDPATSPSTSPATSLLPTDWIELAIDAADALNLVEGDRVAILADGTVLSESAVVTRADGYEILVALPITDAGAVAAAGSRAVVGRASVQHTGHDRTSTTTPSPIR